MRKAIAIELTENEEAKLRLLAARPKTSQRDAKRAGIILCCAQGLENKEVARKLGVTVQTVGKWRRRFHAARLEGLVDLPRSGSPRTISDEKVEEVVTKTLESKPRGKTHWSSRTMAGEAGVSDFTVRRIWHAFGLKPHQSRTFKISTDPCFVEKVRDIVGLYMNPPEKAVVLCVDEKSQTQALNRTQPILPLREDLPEAQTHDYERNGVVSLFAAYDIATGKVLGKLHERHRQQEFIKFLNEIDKAYPEESGQDIHIVMDNYGTHKTDRVDRWFRKHPRFKRHFTPTSASWINQVERWFAKITNDCIKRGSFGSVKQLRDAINEYIAMNNDAPTPFKWVADADTILEKVRDTLIKRSSTAGH